ncbi:MAG: MFS transporter [Gammaproteobacteria bacterium]|nr:MFS transporter [Gammaproteobacteria bacterium]
MMLSGTSMLVLIAGIIGSDIAPNTELATLPIALSIVGVACATVPTSLLMARFGRKKVFLTFAVIAILSALLAAYAIAIQHFYIFCLAALCIGFSTAAVQQYRFAAIELVPSEAIPKTASTILLGGIAAAVIGPELTLLGRDLLSIEYLGSFMLLALVYCGGFALLTQSKDAVVELPEHQEAARRKRTLLTQPNLLVAITAAAIGYGVMSFLMTATPLSMHNHYGHSLADTKWVIQSHVAAMYLPSLISGLLIERLGHFRMMGMGILSYIAVLLVAYSSQDFWSFWVALVLLGVGWNFLFVAGTSLLATTYRANERFKVQAFNDLLVFSTQAIAALSSGWLLAQYQWQGLLLFSFVPIVLISAILLLKMIKQSSASRPQIIKD